MEISSTFQQLGTALGLGLLVGLQRERAESRLAGFRTFPLLTVFGSVCGLLAARHGGWIIGLGLLALAAVILADRRPLSLPDAADPGVTTEVAALLMFGIGAYLVLEPDQTAVAVTLGASAAVLLHLKPQMHALATRLGESDFTAIMQFVLISLVILPVLPNRAFGPYLVLNPHQIWLMVVLIVGISLGGYVAHKLLGEKAGAASAGILGGLISSTATTISYCRRSRAAASQAGNPEAAGGDQAAIVILIASTVVFARLLVLIAVVAPAIFARTAPPLAVMLAVMAALSFWLWWHGSNTHSTQMPQQANPTELVPAIIMGALYAVVLLAVAAAKEHFGQGGLYAVGALSGLSDMDAITLSSAQLVAAERLAAETGWRLILVAALVNLMFKTVLIAVLGTRRTLARFAPPVFLSLVTGALLLWLWPAS